MPHEQLERSILLIPRMLDKAKTIDGGAKDANKIMIIGFDVAVFCGPVVIGGKRMNEASLKARISEGAENDLMIAARHFDADNGILNLEFLDCLFKSNNRSVKITLLMLDDGRLNEDSSVEIAEEPL
jgi:hypothetical protein